MKKGGPYPFADLDGVGSKSAGGPNPLYDTGIFETLTDIDDFTICPTHIDVG